MSQFLSPEWLRELAAEATASEGLREAASGVTLTVQHVVTDGSRGDVAFRVRFENGAVAVEEGAGDADVAVCLDRATATAISTGEMTTAGAFAAGRVRLGGRPGLLAQHREALGRLGDVFADLRARTDYR